MVLVPTWHLASPRRLARNMWGRVKTSNYGNSRSSNRESYSRSRIGSSSRVRLGIAVGRVQMKAGEQQWHQLLQLQMQTRAGECEQR